MLMQGFWMAKTHCIAPREHTCNVYNVGFRSILSPHKEVKGQI